jgi:hypothetical protein
LGLEISIRHWKALAITNDNKKKETINQQGGTMNEND